MQLILLSPIAFCLLYWFPVVQCDQADRVFQVSSKRSGKGQDDVVSEDIETFVKDVILEQEELVMNLDFPWSMDSKRGWPVMMDIYGNLTKSDGDRIPMYVYQAHHWFPKHEAFRKWWDDQGDFTKQGITKYRAILLVIKKGRIQQMMINAVVGEGGGFCVHKVIMNALSRPVDPSTMAPKKRDYYEQVCVGALHHPERAQYSIVMAGSPCGWQSPGQTPSTCEALKDEL